jgi:cytochrome c-type biogenesis protein CcmH/NrfG
MLWFGLGRTLLELSLPEEAADAFEHATQIDPDYTAAFRDLGRAKLESGDATEAARVFAHAIALAEKTGDLQTGREIHVFLRRAEGTLSGGDH